MQGFGPVFGAPAQAAGDAAHFRDVNGLRFTLALMRVKRPES